jgi:hypothetical protein
MTEPCKCKTLEEGSACKRRCLPMTGERWWELCSGKCPPERPCNQEDSDAVRAHCDGSRLPAPPPHVPTKAELLARFLQAIATEIKWRATGGRGPTVEEKAIRRAHCDACKPHHDPETDSCTYCGCYLEAHLFHLPPIPLGKLDCSCQSCPLSLWGAVAGCKPTGCGGNQPAAPK